MGIVGVPCRVQCSVGILCPEGFTGELQEPCVMLSIQVNVLQEEKEAV
jgi:hypothetical protein